MTRDERIFRKGFEMGGRVARAVLTVAIRDTVFPSKAHADSAWLAQTLCASSFSWCGKIRSRPPPWISTVVPSTSRIIAEHSICHPGRPRPHGDSHPGCASALGFHSTKSAPPRL